MDHPVTSRAFRSATGLFATGITVLSAKAPSHVHGMTANAFASISLEPLLVLVSVRREAFMHEAIGRAGAYAVSLLASEQEPVARWFADPDRPRGARQFDPVGWRAGPATGAPLIEGALAWLECRLHDTVEAGDHALFLGRVVTVETTDRRDPLLFFGGSFQALDGSPADANLRQPALAA